MSNLASIQPLIALYQGSTLAVAYVEADAQAAWQVLWQNSAAVSQWGGYDINADMELKLHLLSALKRTAPSSFSHQLPRCVDSHQFTLFHFQQGLVVQFSAAEPHALPLTINPSEVNLYRGVLDAAGLGVFDWDVQADRLRYNERLYQLCDVSPLELGQCKAEFIARIHPQDQARFEDALFAHIEAHWPFNVSFRFQTASQSYIWLQATGQAYWDESRQQALRLIGSLRDISDAKRNEQTVRQREALIEQILDALPISIYVKDAQGCFRFFSQQTEKLTGVLRSKAIGRTDFEVYPIDFAREQVAMDQQAKQQGQLIVSEEEVDLPTGKRWLMCGRGPIEVLRPEQKSEVWILGFSLDITERREMEEVLKIAREQAEAAAKAKSEFLSVMSHEIRTPLNSVIGTSALLLDSAMQTEQRQQIEMIKRAGEHLLHLINDILDFNKLDAGQVQLENQAFSLYEQLETAMSMVKTHADVKQVALRCERAPNLVNFIRGDESRLRQILLNLLGNSVKFTEQGSVCLSVMTSPTHANMTRFEIRDTGIGIAPDKLGSLFSEFTQADASTTRKYGGTGLGLSISKKLVEAMGGEIGVSSELGVGSCFWFEVPTPPADEQEVQRANLQENYDDQQSLNVLVAEDNPSNQLLIRAILTKLNHRVTIAANGYKVIECLQACDEPFDVILMDMQMPEMDGLEATAYIRRLPDPRLATLPIIALTANALSGDKDRVIAAGMNDYLSKPIDIHALKQALWRWSHQVNSI
ncbi:MAG: ATP-binding protein [Thiomicrospira sp.]